jgi:soluble lytic murein transglycosylase
VKKCHLLISLIGISLTSLLAYGSERASEWNYMEFVTNERQSHLAAKSENAAVFEELYSLETASIGRFMAAMVLAGRYVESDPKLALQYITSVDEIIKKTGRSELKQIIPVYDFYYGLTLLHMGLYKEATAKFLMGVDNTAIKIVRIKSIENLIEAYIGVGDKGSAADVYRKYEKDFGKRLSDGILMKVAEVFFEQGDVERYYKVLEIMAVKYPTTRLSGFAFKRLLQAQHPLFSGARPYVFSVDMLKALTWNSTINNGLQELLVGLLDSTLAISGTHEVRKLTEIEKARLLMHFRRPEESFKIIRELEYASLSARDRLAVLELADRIEGSTKDLVKYGEFSTKVLGDSKNDGLLVSVREKLARSLARNGQTYLAALEYDELFRDTKQSNHGWSALINYSRANQIDRALSVFDEKSKSMNDLPIEEKRWDYFRSKMLLGSGNSDDSIALLKGIVEEDSTGYYGVLARSLIDQLIKTGTSLSFDSGDFGVLEKMHTNGNGLRNKCSLSKALSFMVSKREQEVERIVLNEGCEFNSVEHKGLKASKRESGNKAQASGEKTGQLSPQDPPAENSLQPKKKNDLVELIERVARQLELDPKIILAIIRAESGFDPLAQSHVGASGLMQVMPYTAMKIALELGDERFDITKLTESEFNVFYGSFYLKSLLKYYEGSVIPAIAAYNAGPIIVNHWLRECANCKNDEFVEIIPYKETRLYVKKVLSNYANLQNLSSAEAVKVNNNQTVAAIKFSNWVPY